MNKKKLAFVHSLIALLLCVSMLVGTTFAWFTDSVSSGNNRIVAGNLDIGLEYWDGTDWAEVVEDTNVFEENTLWEPGHTEVVYLKVSNLGTLALKYQLGINIASETGSVNVAGERFMLSDYIRFAAIEGVETPYTDRAAARAAVTRSDVLAAGYTKQAVMEPGAAAQYVALVVYMPEEVDNAANYKTGYAAPEIKLGIDLFATQQIHENDSFGNDYDITTELPEFLGKYSMAVDVTGLDEENKTTDAVTIAADDIAISAEIPVGVSVAENASQLILEVSKTDRSSNITLEYGQASRSLDVHIEGIAEDNEVPVTISLGVILPTSLSANNVMLYHVEDGTPVLMTAVTELTDHNQYIYDAATGEVTICIKSFSEITAVAAVDNPWDGDTVNEEWGPSEDGTYTINTPADLAAFSALVGKGNTFAGKTVVLGDDLNMGSHIFEPIGYYYTDDKNGDGTTGDHYSTVYSFEGTFDGQDHTISNIYQSTWEIKGDNPNYDVSKNQYYNDGMGLFGYVLNGTVQNLVIDNFQSDGEFTMTGCVAAYAGGTSTFYNIRIVNSNPRVYNTGNGGVVGYAESGSNITFTNINVDDSNKISALWGSWDVACAGILGRMADTATITMSDCGVSAQIDVYNDVCGNYQYYQYRYCGMLIGTAGSDSDPEDQINNVTFSNCHVAYGDWANYYYCELEANSLASYSEDYQFSRLEKISSLSDIQSASTWTKEGNFLLDGECYHIIKENGALTQHTHTQEEDKQIVLIPFKQVYTGYGWGSAPSAGGVNTNEYIYSITYMYDRKVQGVEYVTNNENAHNISTEYNAQATPDGYTFKTWVTAGSVAFENDQIPAGNEKDIVLYPSYENIYTARWVDEDGVVIHEATFTKQTAKLPDVAGPASSEEILEFDHWEVKKEDNTYVPLGDYKLSSATGDITLYPYYNIKSGGIGLTAVDTDGDGRANYYTVEAVDATNIGTKVTIPGNVNGVPVKVVTDLSGGWASSVENVVIEEGVEEINAQAFGDTQNLETVELPSTIKTIENSAFAGDWSNIGGIVGYEKVLTITYNGTKEQWDTVVANSNQNGSQWEDGLAEGTTVVCTDGVYTLSNKSYQWGTGFTYTWQWTAK